MIGHAKRRLKRTLAERLLAKNRARLESSGVFRNERLSESLWDAGISPEGRLTSSGIDLTRVAQEYGTPLHVVDVARLRRNYENFLSAFSTPFARVRLGTSYKTNPLPYVLGRLHEFGSMAEVISHFELWLALRLGVPGERIIFNGPAKPLESLELAVEAGVGLTNLDSFAELEELDRIARLRGVRQRVGIRVTTDVGWQSQFGFSIPSGNALRAIETASRCSGLEVVGIHLHLGTGISSIETYARGISEVTKLARVVRERFGVNIVVLDLGGGFGVPTTGARDPWDSRLEELGLPARAPVPSDTPGPRDYAARVLPIIEEYFGEMNTVGEVIFEPGRAITASAQMLLLSVLRVKEDGRSVSDVILNGGRNVCLPVGYEYHEVLPVSRMLETRLAPQNLYGPLCHPYDYIGLNKRLPRLEPGDVVAVMDAGAYFITNQSNFSNPRPGAVALEDGVVLPIRAAERFDDLVRLDALDDPHSGLGSAGGLLPATGSSTRA